MVPLFFSFSFRFPGLFRVYDEGGGNIWFTFTREAEEQYSQERALKQTLEDLAVTKVRRRALGLGFRVWGLV